MILNLSGCFQRIHKGEIPMKLHSKPIFLLQCYISLSGTGYSTDIHQGKCLWWLLHFTARRHCKKKLSLKSCTIKPETFHVDESPRSLRAPVMTTFFAIHFSNSNFLLKKLQSLNALWMCSATSTMLKSDLSWGKPTKKVNWFICVLKKKLLQQAV